jgi:NAD(P)-dependent dehydrogenase (short-subunit alcohol dehydrogenase family)
MTGRLSGRVVLVTGASRGFGRATALLCAQEGADVVVSYRAERSAAEALAQEIGALGRRAALVQADVADPDQVRRLADDAAAAFSQVDVLVNNAGIMDVRPFAEQDAATWRAMLDVNIVGTLALTHALLPRLAERGQGRVICLASQLGHVGGENFAVYSGTKGFVLAFVKSLAREIGRLGITVNAVCPGSIVTDMNRAIFPPDRQATRAAELPLRRMGDPRDVAEAVLFLAADSGRFITGQCVDVNGGATMA